MLPLKFKLFALSVYYANICTTYLPTYRSNIVTHTPLFTQSDWGLVFATVTYAWTACCVLIFKFCCVASTANFVFILGWLQMVSSLTSLRLEPATSAAIEHHGHYKELPSNQNDLSATRPHLQVPEHIIDMYAMAYLRFKRRTSIFDYTRLLRRSSFICWRLWFCGLSEGAGLARPVNGQIYIALFVRTNWITRVYTTLANYCWTLIEMLVPSIWMDPALVCGHCQFQVLDCVGRASKAF